MIRKLTIVFVVLFGLLALGSSRSTYEDDEISFDNEEEDSRFLNEEEIEFLSQLQETRVSFEFFSDYNLTSWYWNLIFFSVLKKDHLVTLAGPISVKVKNMVITPMNPILVRSTCVTRPEKHTPW